MYGFDLYPTTSDESMLRTRHLEVTKGINLAKQFKPEKCEKYFYHWYQPVGL